jgi:predicted ATPase
VPARPSSCSTPEEASVLVLGEAVLRLLSSWLTPRANALVVVEDLQWADPESVAVLEYLVDATPVPAPVTSVAGLDREEWLAGINTAA